MTSSGCETKPAIIHRGEKAESLSSEIEKLTTEKIAGAISTYTKQLHGLLLRGPKTYIRTLDLDRWETFRETIIFFFVTFAIYSLVFDVWEQRTIGYDMLRELGRTLIFSTFVHLILGLVAAFCWLLVGGNVSPPLKYVTITLYISAISLFLLNLGTSIQLSVVQYFEPNNLNDYKSYFCEMLLGVSFSLPAHVEPPANSEIVGKVLFIGFVFSTLGMAWLYLCWGAFREAAETGKIKSLLAAIFWLYLSHEVAAAFKALALALHYGPC